MNRIVAILRQFLFCGIALLTGCTSSSTYFSQPINDCETLAAKRNQQPTARQIRKFNKKDFVQKQFQSVFVKQENSTADNEYIIYNVDSNPPLIEQDFVNGETEVHSTWVNEISTGEEQASASVYIIDEDNNKEQQPETGQALDNFDTKRDNTATSDYWLWLIAVPALASMGLISLFPSTAVKLSAWAAHHPYLGRTILVVSESAGALGATWLGHDLANQGITLPPVVLATAAGTLLVASYTYPQHSFTLLSFTRNYLWRKFHDVALFSSATVMMFYAGNTNSFAFQQLNTALVVSEQVETAPLQLEQKHLTGKYVMTAQDPSKKSNRGVKVIFAIFGFIVLSVAVGVGACLIACAGNEALAVTVAVLGEGALIFGLARLLRRIRKGKPVSKTEETAPVTQ